MKKDEKVLAEELKLAQIQLKELRKLVQKMNKQLKKVEKGELKIEDIKPLMENR